MSWTTNPAGGPPATSRAVDGSIPANPPNPTGTAGDLAGFKLLDLSGAGRLDVVDLAGPVPGFFERTEDANFEALQRFAALPQLDWSDPNNTFIGVTGDGLADIMITENNLYTVHASLCGAARFDSAQFVRPGWYEEKGPPSSWPTPPTQCSPPTCPATACPTLFESATGKPATGPTSATATSEPKSPSTTHPASTTKAPSTRLGFGWPTRRHRHRRPALHRRPLGYRTTTSPTANLYVADVQTPVTATTWDAQNLSKNRVAQLYGGYVLPGSQLDVSGGVGVVVSQWDTTTGWPYRTMQFKVTLNDTTKTSTA